MLFAFFGIGFTELVILAIVGLILLAIPAAAILVVMTLSRRRPSSEESREVAEMREEIQRLRAEIERLKNGSAKS